MSERSWLGNPSPATVLRGSRSLLPLVLLALWAVFLRPDTLGGPASYVTVSGRSMLPALRPGDLVVTTRAPAYEVGDVVAYRVPDGEAAAGARVIHRIVGNDGAGGYILRGDNTSGPDVWHPTSAEVVGRAWLVLPGVGNMIGLLRQPAILASIAAAVFFVYMWPRPQPPRGALEGREGTRRLPTRAPWAWTRLAARRRRPAGQSSWGEQGQPTLP